MVRQFPLVLGSSQRPVPEVYSIDKTKPPDITHEIGSFISYCPAERPSMRAGFLASVAAAGQKGDPPPLRAIKSLT